MAIMAPPLQETAQTLQDRWDNDPRWQGIRRRYSAEEVIRLRTSLPIEHSIAKYGAQRLWDMLATEDYVKTFGAITGAQAVQMVRAGLRSIYVSGWQVAADGNLAAHTYPDQSLYPANSVPQMVRRINNALMRADQIDRVEGNDSDHWYVPVVADAEAGFGGPLNAYELTRAMIEAGAAGVHFEDQLAAEKKCGHLGGKVLIPTSQFIRTLTSARLAADAMGVDMILIARTDAEAATLLTNDIDPYDRPFLTGERTPEGYHYVKPGIEAGIARALAYAPYSDIVWLETKTPDLDEAREFAEAVHAEFPDKMLAYNNSPSFNWKRYLDDETIAKFQRELGAMGYKYQFITLAGWHMINYHTYAMARDYKDNGMTAYSKLQEAEFELAEDGYTAVKHQREAGTGYFDQVLNTITQGEGSTTAYAGSTESEQF